MRSVSGIAESLLTAAIMQRYHVKPTMVSLSFVPSGAVQKTKVFMPGVHPDYTMSGIYEEFH